MVLGGLREQQVRAPGAGSTGALRQAARRAAMSSAPCDATQQQAGTTRVLQQPGAMCVLLQPGATRVTPLSVTRRGRGSC